MGQAWKTAHPAVRALVVLLLLQVVVSVASIPLSLSRVDDVIARGNYVDPETTRSAARVGVVVGPIIALALYVWLALKILTHRRWAWITMLVLASLGLLGALVGLSGDYATALTYVGAALIMAIFVLLLVRPVREHVRPQQPQFAGYGPYGGPPPGYGAPPGYAGPPPQAPPGWGQPQQQAPQQQGWGQPSVQPQAAPPSQSAPPPQAAPPSPPPAQGGFAPPS